VTTSRAMAPTLLRRCGCAVAP